MNIEIVLVDYSNRKHAEDLIFLLDQYALDPMGGGKPLSSYSQANLIPELLKIPGAFSLLCYVDEKSVGFCNCFQGFSTFKCKPIINIHDISVLKAYRKMGISKNLLNKVQEIAVERDCCKITLEVLEENKAAKITYTKFGFEAYELDSKYGKALFWEKEL